MEKRSGTYKDYNRLCKKALKIVLTLLDFRILSGKGVKQITYLSKLRSATDKKQKVL